RVPLAAHLSLHDALPILEEHEIPAHACAVSKVGIVLDANVQVPDLPGFDVGGFSVQDEHAQLCATLLPNLDDKFVIDACAAPGGDRKSTRLNSSHVKISY